MKKKLLIAVISIVTLIIIVISVIILYNMNDYSNVTVKTIDIMGKISDGLDDGIHEMMQLDEQEVIDTYGIDITKVEDYIIKIPIMNIRSNEIAIIKVKNRSDVEYIKNKFSARAKAVQGTFEGYLQDQYELAKNPLIISKGKYVLMSISDRNDDIEKIFLSYFTNNK